MIQWGLAGRGGFENALSMGMQFGQQIRQRREEKEYNNALAGYDPEKPETIKPIMAADPRLGIQLRRDQAQQQQAQQRQRNEQMGTMRRLLQAAESQPERAFAAAQSMGMDLSQIPQPGTPEFEPWRQQQMLILDALEDPEKLTAIQKDVQSLGIDPSTPEGMKAVTELTLHKYAKPVTDEYGRPALSMPTIRTAPPKPAEVTARPEGMSDDDLIKRAQDAISKGADVNEVFKRLKAWGVDAGV